MGEGERKEGGRRRRGYTPPTAFRVSNCSGGTCLWSRKRVTARGNGGDFIKLVWERQERNSHARARARECCRGCRWRGGREEAEEGEQRAETDDAGRKMK